MKIPRFKALYQNNWKTAARMIISAGLLAWLALLMDWQELAQVWAAVEPRWIAGAMAGIVVSMVISVRKWQLLLEAQGMRLSWSELWKSYWAGIFFNNFLPSSIGGDGLRIWWIGKTAGDIPGVAASVVVERILATTGLALVGLAGALMVDQPDWRVMALLAGLIIGTLSLLVMMFGTFLPRWASSKSGRVIDFVRKMIQHGARIKHYPSTLARVGILSLAFQSAVVGINYCIFQALNVTSLSVWDLTYVIPAVSAAAMLPLGINGYGLREGAYVAMLGDYGISAGAAFSVSLIFVFLVSLCSLYGGYTWFNNRGRGEIADVKRECIPHSSGGNEVRE